jgi:DNA recombination-mediator protein A
MSVLRRSGPWSTNSAAQRPPSTRCPRCRAVAGASMTSAFAARKTPQPSLQSPRVWARASSLSESPGYPPALAQVDAPPPLLCVKGRLDLPDIPIVAIVGARNGSAVGQKFTRALATDLGQECHRLWTNNLLKQGRVPCDISARHRRDVGASRPEETQTALQPTVVLVSRRA